jgi:hypothetical protein
MQLYQWSKYYHHLVQVPAQTVGEAVTSIESRDGHCTPAALIEEAGPDESSLHSLFDWDQEVAAHKWRVAQARNVINHIRVIDRVREEPVVAFISVNNNGDRGYISIAKIAQDEDLQRQAVEDVMVKLMGLRKRHADISYFAKVWGVVDELNEEQSEAD